MKGSLLIPRAAPPHECAHVCGHTDTLSLSLSLTHSLTYSLSHECDKDGESLLHLHDCPGRKVRGADERHTRMRDAALGWLAGVARRGVAWRARPRVESSEMSTIRQACREHGTRLSVRLSVRSRACCVCARGDGGSCASECVSWQETLDKPSAGRQTHRQGDRHQVHRHIGIHRRACRSEGITPRCFPP